MVRQNRRTCPDDPRQPALSVHRWCRTVKPTAIDPKLTFPPISSNVTSISPQSSFAAQGIRLDIGCVPRGLRRIQWRGVGRACAPADGLASPAACSDACTACSRADARAASAHVRPRAVAVTGPRRSCALHGARRRDGHSAFRLRPSVSPGRRSRGIGRAGRQRGLAVHAAHLLARR